MKDLLGKLVGYSQVPSVALPLPLGSLLMVRSGSTRPASNWWQRSCFRRFDREDSWI
jgi:hypothetical protein